MALPKLDVPVFELELPISKRKIKYRPFLVKEEKILLIAQENTTRGAMVNSLVQVVNNCVIDEDLDVRDLPMVELEYIFLQLRAKSVGNTQKIILRDKEDDQQYELEVDLDQVQITIPEVIDKIDLTDEIGLIMKPPSVNRMANMPDLDDTDLSIEIFKACIDKIYDENDVYEAADHTKEELDEFVQGMTTEQFQRVEKFFLSLPKLQHTLTYTNSKGNERSYELEGLADFFQ